MFLLSKLTNLLPKKARPYAKALWPSIGALVAVGVQVVSTGNFDSAELATALTGGLGALVTLAVPNHTARPR
jgi:hypothetical protein